MLVNLCNWIVLISLALPLGGTLVDLFYRIAGMKAPSERVLSGDLAAGILFLTVYAQIASLFGGVGLPAFLVLIALAIPCAILSLRRKKFRKPEFVWSKRTAACFAAAALILLFFLYLSALRPSSYDDYLYHAEAIAWIEKYGAVPGLANLHGRFGFNSAFLCLAALFSWTFTGVSLHAVNGLLAGLMAIYCVLTLSIVRGRKALTLSDLLKLVALIYIFGNTAYYSGADTDPSAMLATLFCFIRYAEIHEHVDDREERDARLSMVAVFSFFACTLKLSAAPVVLLTLEPLIHAIRAGKGRVIAASALGACFSVIPFLIRNVILTGYLVYPFPGLDLFSFDFKVPISSVRGESESVTLWGRHLMDLVYDYSWENLVDMPLTQWGPRWFGLLSTTSQLFLILDAVLIPVFLVFVLQRLIRHKTKPGEGWKFFLFLAGAVCLCFWLFTAPSERFGGIYLLLPVAIALGSLEAVKKRERWIRNLGALCFGVLALLRILTMWEGRGILERAGSIALIPADYDVNEMDEAYLTSPDGNTFVFYYPAGDASDQGDYVHFPSAPSSSYLNIIEMRGDSLKDGFRSTLSE